MFYGLERKYMIFVERVRSHAEHMDTETAVKRAVDECISEGVLAEFLLANKSEAIAMSIYEYDEEQHMKAEREEHYALGYQDEIECGMHPTKCGHRLRLVLIKWSCDLTRFAGSRPVRHIKNNHAWCMVVF